MFGYASYTLIFFLQEVSKTDFYTCKMILQTAQRRVDGGPLSTPEEKAVLDALVAKMSSISEAL